MRVLVVPSWYPNKLEPLKGIFFQEQARALSDACDISIVYPMGQTTRNYLFQVPFPPGSCLLEDPPVTIVRYPVYRWTHSWEEQLKSIGEYGTRVIRKIEIDQGPVDVILAEEWAGACWAAEWGKRCHLPVVVVAHSNPLRNPGIRREAFLNAIAQSTVFCVVSPVLRGFALAFAEENSLLDPLVVGNLIDTDFFALKDLQTASKEFRILAGTSSSRDKDMDNFIRAIAYARQMNPNLPIRARIIGIQPAVRENYRLLCSSLGIQNIVEIEGPLSRAGVREAMQVADLFVSSSIFETFGIAMAEALACGTPVVATRSGGAEFILGESSPFLVEIRASAALGSKITEVLHGDVLFDAAQFRDSIVSRFGKQAFVQRMMRVFRAAISEYREPGTGSTLLPEWP